jgi:hypothetical protein
MAPKKNVAAKKKEQQPKRHYPFQLYPLHNMHTCLMELGGRSKIGSQFVEHQLDPTRLNVVLSLVCSLLITKVSDSLKKWRLENPTITAASTAFTDFVNDVILHDHRVREINEQRWSQLQKEGQKVTKDEFQLYAQYVWGQWARQKSKGIKLTQEGLKASSLQADGESVTPPVSTPQNSTTPRKRIERVAQQPITPPSSSKISAGVHVRKKRRRLAVAPLKDLIQTYMVNGIVTGPDLRSFISTVETTMEMDSSADDASETFKEGIPLL